MTPRPHTEITIHRHFVFYPSYVITKDGRRPVPKGLSIEGISPGQRLEVDEYGNIKLLGTDHARETPDGPV